jgi:hypothetical protein
MTERGATRTRSAGRPQKGEWPQFFRSEIKPRSPATHNVPLTSLLVPSYGALDQNQVPVRFVIELEHSNSTPPVNGSPQITQSKKKSV